MTCPLPSGTVLPVGRTNVLCTATDASGNTSTCSFTISVYPAVTNLPTILGATNQVVEATAPGSGATTYDATANHLNGTLVNGPAVASTLPFGGYALAFDGWMIMSASTAPPAMLTITPWRPGSGQSLQLGWAGLSPSTQNPGRMSFTLRLSSVSPYSGINFDQMQTPNGILVARGVAARGGREQQRHAAALRQRGGQPPPEHLWPWPIIPIPSARSRLLDYPRFFHGQMDEVRIWNVAPQPGGDPGSMNQPLAGTEPGLVAYYRFDEAAAPFSVTATNTCQPNVPVTCTPPSATSPGHQHRHLRGRGRPRR